MEKAIDLRKYKKALLTMGFITLSIIIPQIFHLCGINGPTFLPMHIPVLLAGFMLGPQEGLMVGILSPIISTALTGMPVEFPMMPIMVFELGTYGLVSGLLTKHTKLPTVVKLLITMLAGRISYAICYSVIASFFLPAISSNLSAIGATITGMPGIIIQIVFITAVMAVSKGKEKEEKEENV